MKRRRLTLFNHINNSAQSIKMFNSAHQARMDELTLRINRVKKSINELDKAAQL